MLGCPSALTFVKRRGHSLLLQFSPYGHNGSSVASVIVTLEELIYKYKSLRGSVFYLAEVNHTACLIQKTLPHGLELALEKCRLLPNSCLRISENRR